jgi:threonine/homoserine/homoserine lactone efflux protein
MSSMPLAPSALTPDVAAALALFALASSITPGPNNAMLMASGANFGFRATGRHLAGVVVGFLVLVLVVGLGLGGVFSAYPVLHDALTLVGAVYLLWLAWKIATAKGIGSGAAGQRPLGFWQAFAFQWVNPKGWAMALGAVTAYAPRDGYVVNVIVVAVVFAAINLPCVAAWTGFGLALRRVLGQPRVLRLFNVSMGLLLAASLYPTLREVLRNP